MSCSFWSFAAIAKLASFIVNLMLPVWGRKRLREYFLLFNSLSLVARHIFSSVSLTSEFAMICLNVLIQSWNSSLRTGSLHCMFSAILGPRWFSNPCWISVNSWVWRNSGNVSSVNSTCLLKRFNCLMHCFSLIDHIPDFSKHVE